jgi:putative transposase
VLAPSVEQRKTWRFRLYPTAPQRARLEWDLRLCCELYNAAVQERREAWRTARVSIGFREQSAQLPAIKAERPDVGAVYSQVLQDVLHRVDRAFGGFFARVRRGDRPGFPRFRSAHRFDSLTYPQLGFRVADRHLHVSKVGAVKIKLHRPIEGRIKTLTIKREAGQWFACFSGVVEPRPLPPSTESIGLDVGLTHFATLSDGTAIANPRHARRAERQLRRAQRRIARRRKGSARRREAVRLFQGCKRRARVGEGRSARHLAALPLRCPRPEDPGPTVASVSGVWALGRSRSCGGAGHSQARTAPSRRNVGADAVRVLRSSRLQAWRVVTGDACGPRRSDSGAQNRVNVRRERPKCTSRVNALHFPRRSDGLEVPCT